MRERGILFSGPMVAALLAGTKTQTRRALSGPAADDAADNAADGAADDAAALAAWRAQQEAALRRRFGAPGDRLWVRERFVAFGHWRTRPNARTGRAEWAFLDLTRAAGHAWRYEGADPAAARDAAAAPTWHPRPALFMPRAASRILLELSALRIERLQDITAADAIAEGIRRVGDAFELPASGADAPARTTADPVQAYRGVWERIHGAGSWDANPWVAVVVFRRVPG